MKDDVRYALSQENKEDHRQVFFVKIESPGRGGCKENTGQRKSNSSDF